MRPVEQRLSDLLHQAAPNPAGVSFADVQRRVRRRRERLLAAATSAAAVLLAGAVLTASALRHGDGREAVTGPSPTPGTVPPHRTVAFQGIDFVLPNGWSLVPLRCGPPSDQTVVVDDHTAGAMCPYVSPPTPWPTSVTLSTVYGPQYALGWPGRRSQWQGQPAWLAEESAPAVTTVTLTLPWLNAVVTARSQDAAEARALLDQVSVHPVAGWEPPEQASSVFIQSLAGRDGDGQGRRNATITAATDVQGLLADLRSLSPVNSPEAACDGSWWPRTALLTVRATNGSTRTYAARFDRCGQVVAGTGGAAVASAQLLADIRRLVPNSGL